MLTFFDSLPCAVMRGDPVDDVTLKRTVRNSDKQRFTQFYEARFKIFGSTVQNKLRNLAESRMWKIIPINEDEPKEPHLSKLRGGNIKTNSLSGFQKLHNLFSKEARKE